MRNLLTTLFALAMAVAGTVAAAPALPAYDFYAAVAMTKAQKNSSTPADSGLYRRNAAGAWHHFGPRILGVSGLAVHPADPRIVLIASSDGVVRSTDGGRTWRKTTGWEVADVRSIVFDPVQPELVYAVTAWGPLRSTDAGATWQLAQKGLTLLFGQTMVADAARSGRVLIGTEGGIYVSRDAAQSWQRAKFPEVPVLRLTQGSSDAKVLLATTLGRGAFLSQNGGESWTPVDPATAGANLYAAAIAPQDAALLALGGWQAGVRVSADGGRTWTDRTAGLPVKNVFVLAFDPGVKGRLWASTFEEGTFYSDDLGRTWQEGGLYGAYGYDFIFIPVARP
ncbi:MAG: YCF48-related protein [Lacunisphaera sp.]|nr:YCF48-related protein [Lacunisphaera sp.]